MKFSFPATPKQEEMIAHRARILWIGTGTKTGKSAGCLAWLIAGMLKGEACCFCGAWFFRSRAMFDQAKDMLRPLIAARRVRVNEARLQVVSGAGGTIDFVSADNPDALFGSNFARLVVDEASRCPREIHGAALTTISATGGKLRLLFNLELGVKNWAISNLLRVMRLTPEQRALSGEDYMTFPTDPLLVPASLVETLRSQMPLPLWEALYLAKIPESDASLFRNLDKIFVGREREDPEDSVQYFLAADLARKQDFTVLTIIDENGRVVATDRFNQASWTLQVERAAMWYRTFHCAKAIVDATGVGDVVAEEFEKAGMNVEPYLFTVPSRRALVEELVVACDNREITIPNTAKFQVYRAELEAMEYQLDGSAIKYAVPGNQHDDALFSLALATHVFRASRGLVLGFLDLLKRYAKDVAEGLRDAYGELVHKPEPKHVPLLVRAPVVSKPTVVDNFQSWLKTHRAPPCPNPSCGSTSTTYLARGELYCNQCHATNGILPSKPVGNQCPAEGCTEKLRITGGVLYCQNHGQVMDQPPVAVGVSRKAYASGVGRFRTFGRFGR